MMIFSLVAMTGLEKFCITSAYLQWLCHSGERPVARGPLVSIFSSGGHFVQLSGTFLAILVKGLKRNTSTGHWLQRRCLLKVFYF